VHSRRARPTLRVLAEDLTDGWESVCEARLIAEGRFDELHPLAELPHPIVLKAAQAVGQDPAGDNVVGLIRSSTTLRLLEVKSSQWRGGIWEDQATGVNWLVVAGIAKGNHQDFDDFYQRVARENTGGDPQQWLPTTADTRLLKQETAARLRTQWELDVQRQVLDGLRQVHTGGSTTFTVEHPVAGQGHLAEIRLSMEPVRDHETDYFADEFDVEVIPVAAQRSSNLVWQLTIRILVALHPPEQAWDRVKDTYTTVAEPGAWTERIADLRDAVTDGALVKSQPGVHKHYSHLKHLAGSTIEGRGIRGLCGVFFVPCQDHEALPMCPECQQRWTAVGTY